MSRDVRALSHGAPNQHGRLPPAERDGGGNPVASGLWIWRLASRIVVQHFMDCVYTDNRRGFIQAILLDGYSNASNSHKNRLIATDRMICELGFRPFCVRANWLSPLLAPSDPIARLQLINLFASQFCVLFH